MECAAISPPAPPFGTASASAEPVLARPQATERATGSSGGGRGQRETDPPPRSVAGARHVVVVDDMRKH
jgi:hypothetical protein